MQDKKTIFTVLILVLIVVGAGLWFFSLPAGRQGKKPPEIQKEGIAAENPLRQPADGGVPSAENNPPTGGLPAFITEESQKTPKKDDFSAFFEESAKQVFVSVEELKKQFSPPISEKPILPPPAAPKPQFISTPVATSTEIILSLTDEEFHFLYPDSFISDLMESQKFIAEYDSAYKPLEKIENDSQVSFIEEKLVAFFVSAGMITKERAEVFIYSIRFTLPELQLVELGYRKSSSSNQSGLVNMCFLPANQKGLFFAGLIERLRSAFIPEAQAAACGVCVYSPVCFQVGASSPTPGINIWRAFCSCTGCYYGQGCLDFCTGMSAIWDPMTGICGCG